MKLLTRRRKRTSSLVDGNGSYDAAAVVSAIAEGRWRVPERFNFTRDVVEVLALDPKRRALTFLGKDGVIQPRSFLVIAEGAARWASLFRENGVEPGDRVLVLTGKTVEWLEVMLAAIKVGAVSVPCPETMSAAALGIRISGSGSKLVVASEAARGELTRIAQAPPVLYVDEVAQLAASLPTEAPTHDTAARDPAFVLTTSGTATGPRGVTHTHGAAFAARSQAEHWLDAGPKDAVWCTADASSAAAVWNALLGPWSRGAEIVLHQGPFDPAERLTLLRRLDTTVLCQTPAEYAALLDAGDLSRHRPPRLRRLVSTGDHLSPDLVAAYEEVWDLTICDGYGQAETGIIVANGAGPGYRMGSIGLPLPGCEVAVIDDQGNELEPGVDGDLALRGRPPSLFVGYWEAPDETKAAFRGDWYVTGDIAAADEDGFLWYLGRTGDVILGGGRRFGPIEVEDALVQHSSVADAAVVGVRDLERGGQYVRAFVVLAADLEPTDRLAAELREHARQSIVGHKVPREIEFVEELPRTIDGKIKRQDLRERPATGLGPLWSSASAPTLAAEPPTEAEAEAMVAAAESFAEAPVADMPAETFLEEPPVFEQAAESAAVLEPEQAIESEPESALELEPEPEPKPALHESAAENVAAPVPDPEFDARVDFVPPVELAREPGHEPEATAAPDLVAAPEPAAEPEPQTAAEPERETDSWTEQAAVAEPVFEPLRPPETPPELVPEPVHEPEFSGPHEREPELIVEPMPIPEPEPMPEPDPEPEPEPEPEPRPAAEVIPLAEPASPAPGLEPEELPDFVVVPGSNRSRPGDTSSDGDSTTLGFKPTAELVLEPSDTRSQDGESKPRRERQTMDRRSGKDRRKRSSHDLGDEHDETGWMQGLSNRLSAYSLSEEDEAAADTDGESTES